MKKLFAVVFFPVVAFSASLWNTRFDAECVTPEVVSNIIEHTTGGLDTNAVRNIVAGYGYMTGSGVTNAITSRGYQTPANVSNIVAGYGYPAAWSADIGGRGFTTTGAVEDIIVDIVEDLELGLDAEEVTNVVDAFFTDTRSAFDARLVAASNLVEDTGAYLSNKVESTILSASKFDPVLTLVDESVRKAGSSVSFQMHVPRGPSIQDRIKYNHTSNTNFTDLVDCRPELNVFLDFSYDSLANFVTSALPSGAESFSGPYLRVDSVDGGVTSATVRASVNLYRLNGKNTLTHYIFLHNGEAYTNMTSLTWSQFDRAYIVDEPIFLNPASGSSHRTPSGTSTSDSYKNEYLVLVFSSSGLGAQTYDAFEQAYAGLNPVIGNSGVDFVVAYGICPGKDFNSNASATTVNGDVSVFEADTLSSKPDLAWTFSEHASYWYVPATNAIEVYSKLTNGVSVLEWAINRASTNTLNLVDDVTHAQYKIGVSNGVLYARPVGE